MYPIHEGLTYVLFLCKSLVQTSFEVETQEPFTNRALQAASRDKNKYDQQPASGHYWSPASLKPCKGYSILSNSDIYSCSFYHGCISVSR